MKTADALADVRHHLDDAGLDDAALEAEVLLMDAANYSRASLYAALHDPLPAGVAGQLRPMVRRRLRREPLAYVTGRREFFSLDFIVDSRVLVPRQETESLVELALDIAIGRYSGRCHIADVGAGSGVIAVSLAVAAPGLRVTAVDSSHAALEVARANCEKHGVSSRVTLSHGDLLAPVPHDVDIIVANLPYVAESEWKRLQPEIRFFEPKEALVPGKTGLETIYRLLGQVAGRRRKPGFVLMELGVGQAEAVAAKARRLLPEAHAEAYHDLGGFERGLVVTLGQSH